MAFAFRDAPSFYRETLGVTAGACVAGIASGLAGPTLGIPLVAAAGAGALAGGTLGAAVVETGPRPAWRVLLGIGTAACAAVSFAILADALDLGAVGLLAGGSVGGALLALLLGTRDVRSRTSLVVGMVSSAAVGAIGALGLARMAAFTTSESVSTVLSSALMAAAYGLWVAAAAGLRRVERVRDPLLARAEDLLGTLAEPLKSKVREGIECWQDTLGAAAMDTSMSTETAAETRRQAALLAASMIDTAQTWQQIHVELSNPRLPGLMEKLADLEQRALATTDMTTAGHLQRAIHALRAQSSALDGLKVGAGRAEAAVEAQGALLERLRLAVAQHRVSDRERFSVELTAVGDQVARLSDDLEALSAAIAEAESLADRKTLADLERAGRRALAQLDETVGPSPPMDGAAPQTAPVGAEHARTSVDGVEVLPRR